MRVSMIVLLSSLALAACGGAAKEAKESGPDPWAGYSGKYAEPATPGQKTAKAEKAAKATEKEAEAPTETPAHAEKEAAAPKPSTATIQGESVSSIAIDSFADASKAATKAKVVSTKYLVGPKYEQLQIQLKGVSVQVIRPAANPAPDGPTFSSPKARGGEVTKTEAGWYDPDADVSVVVTAGGKAGAQKLLGSLVKH